MNDFRENFGLAFTFVFLTVVYFFASDYWVGFYDEGLILTGAFRVLNGEFPSRDFYTNYGPGQFFVLAGLFKVFGSNLLVARVYDGVVCASVVLWVFLIVWRDHPTWLGISCALAASGLLLEYRGPLSPVSPCVALSLYSAFYLSILLARGGRTREFLSLSLAWTAAFLFRYDLGLILGAASLVAGFLVSVYSKFRMGERGGFHVRALLPILGAPILLPATLILLLGLSGILIPAMTDLLEFNTANYVATRWLPFPGPLDWISAPVDWFAVYFPIAATGLGFVTLTRSGRTGSPAPGGQTWILILILTVYSTFFLAKGWVRTSGQHMLFSSVPATVLFFLSLFHLIHNEVFRFKLAFTLGLIGLDLALVLNWTSRPLYRFLGDLERVESIPALSIFQTHPDRVRAIHYIISHTDEGERILSATGRHDKIFVNDVAIYFLAGRLPGTRWHQYDPGVQTELRIQEQIIRDLEENEVHLILRYLSWDDWVEPNESALSSGVFALDRYLAEDYQTGEVYSDFVLEHKK